MSRLKSGGVGEVFFVFFGLVILPVLAYFMIMGFTIWVAGSAVTSGVKALSNSCGKTYTVERVFSGDWFCPEDGE